MKFNCLAGVAGLSLALTLCLSGSQAMAQPGGGFGGGGGGGFGGFGGDPVAQAQQQADRMRPDLAVTNDDEWNVIRPRLVKVMQLQGEVRMAGMANMIRGMAGRGGGGGGRTGGLAALIPPDPAGDALTKALDDNAPIAEVKAAMAQVREARKRKLAEMTKAQSDLKDVISVRQEAYLLDNGMLD